ncbi:hypothetical protein WR25_13618 [Diploscapter pachys]|uniref:Phospholipase A2 n=1 Tax=Diploscapter pachys TaxID=2018661 RepID=A0A2A2KPW2_9BILA|nr:hypothetical protein WR25_13618 [Diploscapter pachys]
MQLFIFLSTLPVLVSSGRIIPMVNALWNLEEVTECVLHYNALTYNDYGCWCGVGGAHEPIDGIDRCCMLHDKCYDAAVDEKKCLNVEIEYIDDYTWHCNNGTATCKEGQSACKAALCDCDVAVANCWHQFPKPKEKKKCNHIDIAFRNTDTFQH